MSRFRINVHATYGPSPSALSLLRGDMPPVDTGEVCRRVAYSLITPRSPSAPSKGLLRPGAAPAPSLPAQ